MNLPAQPGGLPLQGHTHNLEALILKHRDLRVVPLESTWRAVVRVHLQGRDDSDSIFSDDPSNDRQRLMKHGPELVKEIYQTFLRSGQAAGNLGPVHILGRCDFREEELCAKRSGIALPGHIRGTWLGGLVGDALLTAGRFPRIRLVVFFLADQDRCDYLGLHAYGLEAPLLPPKDKYHWIRVLEIANDGKIAPLSPATPMNS